VSGISTYLGPFSIDTLDYDSPITYEITSHHRANTETDTDDVVIQALVDMPWELTKTQLVDIVGGNHDRARASVDRLEELRRIRHARVGRVENGRVMHRDLYAMFSEPVPEDPR